jgi:hypothetical protein
LRARVQGRNESLRDFLVDIGSKLKGIGYDRDLWLDLIYPALRPKLQQAITHFGMDEIKSFDSLMESAEKIEGIASALGNKDGSQVTINSVQSEIAL